MEDIYILSNILFLILAFFYFSQIKNEQQSKHKIRDLFLNYKPQRHIYNEEFITKRFLLYVYPRLKPFNVDYFSKRGFKNLEFCFTETLLNILNEYIYFNNQKNDYMLVKLNSKFNKFIKIYLNCFIENEEIILTSLGQRIIKNLKSCELDLFNFYHFLYKNLNMNYLENIYIINGIESYLHKNEVVFINDYDIKINKNEIFNLYKYCFKNISHN